jgi:hypothetical protein
LHFLPEFYPVSYFYIAWDRNVQCLKTGEKKRCFSKTGSVLALAYELMKIPVKGTSPGIILPKAKTVL